MNLGQPNLNMAGLRAMITLPGWLDWLCHSSPCPSGQQQIIRSGFSIPTHSVNTIKFSFHFVIMKGLQAWSTTVPKCLQVLHYHGSDVLSIQFIHSVPKLFILPQKLPLRKI